MLIYCALYTALLSFAGVFVLSLSPPSPTGPGRKLGPLARSPNGRY
jgi:hypothetical protein